MSHSNHLNLYYPYTNPKGCDLMRTLEEIREQYKRKDMLLTGMEDKPVQLPAETIKEMKDFYKYFIKPTRERVFARYKWE